MQTPHDPNMAAHAELQELNYARLMSLLAMAGGALAMPQASEADIIFTDLSSNPITLFGTNNASFLISNIPGTARLGFEGRTIVNPGMNLTTHSVRASQQAGYVRLKTDGAGFVALAGRGLLWGQIPGVSSLSGYAAIANQHSHSPSSFDHLFMVFKFKDSTLPAPLNLRYGWIDISLENQNGAPPILTIFGYAYDDTGLPIPTGVVPEPAPVSLFALGALTLGARGLRKWRRRRA